MVPIQSQDFPNAIYVVFKFGIIKAKKGEIVRDRGSNMSKMVQPKAKA